MMANMGKVFRFLLALSGIAMFAIRIYYQSKVLHEDRPTRITGTKWHLIPGTIAALVTIVFGFAYVFFPSGLSWSYISIPVWLRWFGAGMLFIGIGLLGSAHHHLGKSFHSLVVKKADQVLVVEGPYRWVRHPIYTAYVLNYIGGGLLAASWVLTFLSPALFILMIALRLEEEERAMVEQFGVHYEQYCLRTPRFLPRRAAFRRH